MTIIVHGPYRHGTRNTPSFLSLRVGREWSWVPDDPLALYGTVHLVYEDFEWSKVGFILVDLGEVSSGLVDYSNCPTRSLLHRTGLRLPFVHFTPSLGEWLAELWVASSI